MGTCDSEPRLGLWERNKLVEHWGTSNPTSACKPVPFYTRP